MPPKPEYADRVFTTAVVEYPVSSHIDEIDGRKDFSPVIQKALELGGFSEPFTMTGINGGTVLTTGFGHATVLLSRTRSSTQSRAGRSVTSSWLAAAMAPSPAATTTPISLPRRRLIP